MKSSIPASNAPNSTSSVSYFVDQKKGEVNELKQLLKNITLERDLKKKRDIVKKVIAYMTLGIDVSRLFTDMIMAIETKDIVMKKMVYLYLCNYAHKQPDMAIMCINTLRRECDNEDPMIRGLALRSLCNLRLESVIEYIEQPLRKALADISPYVRKTGIMGILKLKQLNDTIIENNGYIDLLYKKLEDMDASVVTNVILALDELLLSKGGIQLTQKIIMYLLSRIGEFSEWGLNAILDLISRYTPSSENEIFSIMNLLDPVLRSSNCGTILATLKCFLHLTKHIDEPNLQTQVYIRVKPSILTMLTGSTSELQYVLLKHLELILQQPLSKGVFDEDYRQLFVRYNESSHVKYMKVVILPRLTNHSNAHDITNELIEYVTDVDRELSVLAINSLSEIALSIPDVATMILEKYIELIDFNIESIQREAVKNIACVLRRYPQLRALILPSLPDYMKRLDDPDACAVVIWMLGEYGEHVPEAPYLFESLINRYDDDMSNPVKLHLLTATMKLFFVRAPEVWSMLGRLLEKMIEDSSCQDGRDRALFYYRMMRTDLQLAESVCRRSDLLEDSRDNNDRDEEGEEEEEEEDRSGYCVLIDETCSTESSINTMIPRFNSLSVVYGKSAAEFIDPAYRLDMSQLSSKMKMFAKKKKTPSQRTQAVPVNPTQVNLLDMEMYINNSSTERVHSLNHNEISSTVGYSTSHEVNHPRGSNAGNGADSTNTCGQIESSRSGVVSQTQTQTQTEPQPQPLLQLLPEEFQELWSGGTSMMYASQTPLVELFSGQFCRLQSPPELSSVGLLEELLTNHQIHTIASGSLAPSNQGIKLFLYSFKPSSIASISLPGGHVSMAVYLLQVVLEYPSGIVNIVIKAASKTTEKELLEVTNALVSSLEVFGVN
eukprot:CAMPEP_0182423356 /NCGR_PEP_ID=MMETSP1167-20130531/9325_1 /TAXON_ID=2988 /ORGANISM="Mallomonas Sp, Strain CCMP3275" /LENGTH=891 /DNA_ID=CAMNT_0024602253 /DNA_START=64 /DNA_END=2739 /DNA_ORIENTATION=+